MNKEWSLDLLYKGYDDPNFVNDMAKLDTLTQQFHNDMAKMDNMDEQEAFLLCIHSLESLNSLVGKLGEFLFLRQSVNTTDPQTTALIGKYGQKEAALSKDEVIARKFIANASCFEQMIESDEECKSYAYYLRSIKKESIHFLSDDVEEMVSKMNLTGAQSWGSLFDYLTSTVKVDYNGEQITLPAVRNLAYNKDVNVRKAAYEAELACYDKIKAPIAYSLNNIKKQVTMLSEMRGYDSPLAMTLEQSKMKPETLDALWSACRKYLPVFHKYMKHKASLLGYKNGLPWYELYAAIGKMDKTYTTLEARDYLVSHFKQFSPDLGELMGEAFDQSWIDFYPKSGKVGGAFCANLPAQKQSRVLTNFDGSFSSITTLAHELGHAYHGHHIEDHKVLNRNYSMPVAETASTFNECVLSGYAISEATDEEKLAMIESKLQDYTQTICDIYSRFLFEDEVFTRTKDEFLFPDQLEEIMTRAQETAYGDGLDAKYRHPFMWANKSHYYSDGVSYYNFPYAFGSLFSNGLYAMYKKEGSSFVPKYQELLRATTVADVEDVALIVGADLTTPKFWEDSLQLIADDVETFINLTK